MKQAPYQLSRHGRYTQVFVFPIVTEALNVDLVCFASPRR